jgi:hypothetical protein
MFKRICFTLLVLSALAFVAAPVLAEEAPALPAAQPGPWLDLDLSLSCSANPFVQYQDPPDPCYVCGPWPEPGGGVGPQCQTNGERKNVVQSCSCPATGGGTIGGTQQIEVVCVGGFWWPSHVYYCVVAGPPHYCMP